MANYLPRLVDRILDEMMGEFSAVMLAGPRGSGKTTTAVRRAESTLRLDVPDERGAFSADPDGILAVQKTPVLIDEWQAEPESLGAVRRAVDAGGGAGRFLLTGSVRARRTASPWAGTGRIFPVWMYSMTVSEILGRAHQLPEDPVSWLGSIDETFTVDGSFTLADQIGEVVRGGFPDAVELSTRGRGRWHDGYIEQLVYRDAPEVEVVRSPERLLQLVRAVALNTAGSPTEVSLAEAAGLDVRTVRSYLGLLEDLGLVDRVPGWHDNRMTRLVKAPKYYLTDSGLAVSLARLDHDSILRSASLLGRTMDTFVAAQLRPLLNLGPTPYTMTHLRDRGGDHEVDLVLESRSGDLIAIEIKAASRADKRDARHLAWFRDRVGDRFRRGLVFHTGRSGYPLGDRLFAVPISMLWQWSTAA